MGQRPGPGDLGRNPLDRSGTGPAWAAQPVRRGCSGAAEHRVPGRYAQPCARRGSTAPASSIGQAPHGPVRDVRGAALR
eukprot:16415956-Heterocapsa_arctica.AAC.1